MTATTEDTAAVPFGERRDREEVVLRTFALVGSLIMLVILAVSTSWIVETNRQAGEQGVVQATVWARQETMAQVTATAAAAGRSTAVAQTAVAQTATAHPGVVQTVAARQTEHAIEWATQIAVAQATAIAEVQPSWAPGPFLLQHEPISTANAARAEVLYRWESTWVTDLAWSPDGRLLALGTSSGVQLYDPQSRQRQYYLGPPLALVYGLTFSPDGSLLAAALEDGTIRLWDTSTWQESTVLEGSGLPAFSVAFSPTGKLLAGGLCVIWHRDWGCLASGVWVWDTATALGRRDSEARVAVLTGPAGEVGGLSFSPDGRFLAAAGGHGTVWTVGQWGEGTVLQEKALVASVAFTLDGNFLAAGGDQIHLLDVDSWRETRVLTGQPGWIWSLAYSPDGTLLTSGSQKQTLLLRHARTGRRLQEIGGDLAAFSPDGSQLAVRNQYSAVYLYDVAAGDQVGKIMPIPNPLISILAVGFRDQDAMIAASTGEELWLWDAATDKGTRIKGADGMKVRSAAFSADMTHLATGRTDGMVQVWEIRADPALQAFEEQDWLLQGGGSVTWLVLSPDGTYLLAGTMGGEAGMWRIADGKRPWPIGSPWADSARLSSAAFSADGKLLALALENGLVQVRDPATGRVIRELWGEKKVEAMAFSPDGSYLVTTSLQGDAVRLWEVATGRPLRSIEHAGWVRSVTFAPDSSLLALGPADESIVLWQVLPWQQLAVLPGYRYRTTGLVFSPDGALLAAGLEGGTVSFFGVK